MEMTRLEKYFVNRVHRGLRNAERVRRAMGRQDSGKIQDVLEIGCGIGTVSAGLADDFGWNVVGTDYDPLQIEEAKSRYLESGGLRFQREDATYLSFSDESFDFAMAQYVLHHIPDWRKAVRELTRVLRPEGLLFCREFALPAGLQPLSSAIGMSDVCLRTNVRTALRESGFTIESEETTLFIDNLLCRRVQPCA